MILVPAQSITSSINLHENISQIYPRSLIVNSFKCKCILTHAILLAKYMPNMFGSTSGNIALRNTKLKQFCDVLYTAIMRSQYMRYIIVLLSWISSTPHFAQEFMIYTDLTPYLCEVERFSIDISSGKCNHSSD